MVKAGIRCHGFTTMSSWQSSAPLLPAPFRKEERGDGECGTYFLIKQLKTKALKVT